MYDYSPESCLIKDIDGQLYNIIDLWKGIKQPVDPSTIQRSYAPRTCLVENIDGTTVNVIDAILSIANGSGAGTSCLQEVIQARNEYRTLDERLDTENKKIYDTLNAKDYLPFKGEYITVPHSKVGFTKDMQIEGMTYQNLIDINKYKSDSIYSIGEDGIITILKDDNRAWDSLQIVGEIIKPNTKYTCIAIGVENFNSLDLCYNGKFITGNRGTLFTFTTENIVTSGFVFKAWRGDSSKIGKFKLMLLEGDYVSKYTPEYFEGIKSVGEKEENKIGILSHGINKLNLKQEFISDFAGVATLKDNIVNINYNKPFEVCLNKNNPIKLNKGTNSISFLINIISGEGVLIKITPANDSTRILFQGDSSSTFNLDSEKYVSIYIVRQGTSGNINISNLILNEGGLTKYEPYKCDKKEILLPFEGGLKGLPNGVKDLIYNKEDGCYVKENIRKVVLNGSEEWGKSGYNWGVYGGWVFYHNIPNLTSKTVICSSFRVTDIPETQQPPLLKGECLEVKIEQNTKEIRIFKKDVTTIEEFKAWLQANPVTVYYELAEPIEHQLPIDNYELKTYADTTHIFSTNTISPVIDCQAPSNPQAVVADLMVANENLNNELNTKTRELQAKDQSLANEDDLLTAKDLDMDFRIFELEEQLTPEIAKLTMNHNSPYPMIKRCIEKGLYEKEDMLYKMNRYLHGKRLTQEEYDELKLMMG